MVEYETPPHSKGLGTDSGLTPDDNPVQGAAILQNGEWPYLWDVSVRLPPDMRELSTDIIQQFERENSTRPSAEPGPGFAAGTNGEGSEEAGLSSRGCPSFWQALVSGTSYFACRKEQEEAQRAEEERKRQAEEKAKARQAELAKVRQARQAQLDTLEARCRELQNKWDSDPRIHMSTGDVLGKDIGEVWAENQAKEDCWKQALPLRNELAQQEAEEEAHSRPAEEKMEELRKTWGDEVNASIGYIGLVSPSSLALFNDDPSFLITTMHLDKYNSIQNLRMFINRTNGVLTITFDCKLNNSPLPLSRMLVRLFDSNGQYLTHFVTAEYFAAPNCKSSSPPGSCNMGTSLKWYSNVLQYTINMRDAAYVQNAEFGLYTGQ
jgi:hypothetical protein